MKHYKLNEVFLDTENFHEPKRLKCVKGIECANMCAYWKSRMCHKIACANGETKDGDNKYFIETNEPLTFEP